MKKFTNKFVAAVASLAMACTLCVAGAVTVSSVAWAAKPGVPQGGGGKKSSEPSKDPWDEKAPKKGTITIIKCVKKAADDSDAQQQCPDGFKPLAGAKFTLTKVTKIGKDDVDLTKFDSWQKIAGIVTKLNDHTINEGTDITLDTTGAQTSAETTAANGTVTFDNIDLGLYKVEETQVPKGYGVSDLKSFYMTLPLPEYTTTGTDKDAKTTVSYNYKPTVKPKNKNLTDTIKKVYDKTKFASVKDKVPFTITAEVNKSKPATGALTVNDFQGYKVFDDAPTAAFNTIGTGVVKHVRINGTEVTNGSGTTYYTVENPIVNSTANPIADDDANENQRGLAAGHTRISVKFEEAGLQKIADAINKCTKAGDTIKVEVDLEFELNSTYQTGKAPEPGKSETGGHNEIVNKSGFFPAHEKNAGDLPPIIPDSEHSQATIDFGYLQVHKFVMKNGKQEPLSDAEFRIFADEKNANACAQGLAENKALGDIDACKAASTISDATATAQPASGTAADVQTATTNNEGKFATPYKTRAGEPVYLVEVKAPKGYALSPSVHPVTVTKDQTKAEDFENFPLKGGDNGKSFWFNLPATGAAGVILFALAGMGLIAASVFLYMRNRKEEEQQQNA